MTAKKRVKRDFILTAVRLPPDDFKSLRKLSYLYHISKNQIMIEGIKQVIKNHEKVLTNSDIVLS